MHQLLHLNQTVVTETSHAPCRVEAFLGGGGQGEVYKANLLGSTVALKWYFPQAATSDQRATLENLVRQGPPDARFLWPLELTSAEDVHGFGYVMPLRDANYKGIKDMMRGLVAPSFYALATAGFQLADGYYQLHSKGLCYRDINFGNVFLNPKTGDILICDNDNVGINMEAPCGVLGTPRFMAPEVVRIEARPSRDTDLYSLSVLLFYLYLLGHPLEGRRETSIKCMGEKAMMKIYGEDPLFIFDPANDANRPDPLVHQNPLDYWSIYPKFLRTLFTRAFTDGLRDPQHGRVRENEWRAALIRLRDSIMACPHCGYDNFYDPDAVQESGGQPGHCWSCEGELTMPFRMRIVGQKTVVVLLPGRQLYPHHLVRDRHYDFSQPLAQVTQHPKDLSVMGLMNLTGDKWVISKTDGEMLDVAPGKNVRVTAGTKINFGTLEGEFRL